MKFSDIEKLPFSSYNVNIGWKYLPENIQRYKEYYNLNIDPDFQRGYVWTEDQKIKFLEWGFKGGKSGMQIHFNHPNWMDSFDGELLLIDGKQRLTTVLYFLDNKIPIFDGNYFKDFEDKMHSMEPNFIFSIFKMKTRKQILKWYLDMNSGGSIHTEKDLSLVRKLLKEEEGKN